MNDETMNDGDAEESESYDCTAHEFSYRLCSLSCPRSLRK